MLMYVLYMMYVAVYLLISFWVMFSGEIWVVYFGIEVQWMVLMVMVIKGSTVWRGIVNYLVMNGIIGVWLIMGIIMSNSLIWSIGILGKVGYFPFYIVLGYQYYNSSYIWMMFDLFNKWAYFGSIVFIVHWMIRFYRALTLSIIYI